jgi:hypothetical protein
MRQENNADDVEKASYESHCVYTDRECCLLLLKLYSCSLTYRK